MANIFAARNFTNSQACMKVINDEGLELSLAFDDSQIGGDLIRTSLAVFDQYDTFLSEVHAITAEEYLEALAKHLGYVVTKQ